MAHNKDSNRNTSSDTKALVTLYHNSHSLVRHHIDSFDHFIDVDMKKIVRAYGRIEMPTLKYFLEISNVRVESPTSVEESRNKKPIHPNECRVRHLTYAGDIVADVKYPGSGNKVIRRERVIIGRLPVMVRSRRCLLHGRADEELVRAGECRYDPGGYFITRGTERVFLMQEQMAKNRSIIEEKKLAKKGCIKVPLAERLSDSGVLCYVVSDTVENKSKTTVFRNSGYFYVANTLFTESVPLFVMLAALNMPGHQDVFQSVGAEAELHNELMFSAKESVGLGVFSQRQALLYLIPRIKVASNKENRMTTSPASLEEEERSFLAARQELHRRFLNHIDGSPDNLFNRAIYLAMMVRRILLAEQGLISADDRDFYGTKRIDPIGSYLSLAFDDRFQCFVDCLKMEISKNLQAKKATVLDPCNLMREGIITEGVFQCLFTGNWRFQRFNMHRNGVTQMLNRLSFIATLGHLGRITSQFEKVRKISGARAIHPSQFGLVCPADTPEGEACGLVKNLAFLSEITADTPTADLRTRILDSVDDEDLSLFRFNSKITFLVALNGVPLGWVRDPDRLASRLREERRHGVIDRHVSIYVEREMDTVHVCSDSGRLVRPYIIVADGRSRLTPQILARMESDAVSWAELVRTGVVEYLDAREAYADCLVAENEAALTLSHTHIDIDPSTALGVVASLIPFPHHNQSPRNTYQCAMGKQALGVVSSNQRQRWDGTQHVLMTPQRPLTLSKVGRLIGYDCLPAGQCAVVAITCFGGHDIEDALIINRASLERGFFRSFTIKSFSTVYKDNEDMAVPAFKNKRQHALDADGTPSIGSVISNGDVVIHKLVNPEKDPLATPGSKPAETGPKPSTTNYSGLEPTQTTQVLLTTEEHGYKMIRVKVCQNRQPEVGDKLSSRHGQKGVIGRVVPMDEMPYTDDGIVPDIIMNPHGFPSRMTVGKLIELLANKAAVLDGQVRDSSAFCRAGHDSKNGGGTIKGEYGSVMAAHGFSASGKETFRSGTTGKIMECDIYTGPVFYQRLRHMVQDKVHARSTGKNMPLTRQPVVGRSQDGGLRVGEMERDCLIGYGATQILKERMMLSSDPFRTFVCEGCGLIATSREWCQMCRSSQHVASVVMPYATKLLLQELMTMQIKPKLTLARNETAML